MNTERTPEFIPERRRFRRYNVPIAVRELRPEMHVMRARDVSAGGLYCPDAAPRRAGETMLLEIDLGPRKLFVAPARVVSNTTGLRLQFASPQMALETALRAATKK